MTVIRVTAVVALVALLLGISVLCAYVAVGYGAWVLAVFAIGLLVLGRAALFVIYRWDDWA